MNRFNPDGSLKIFGKAQEVIDKNNYKMKNTRCIEIKKDIISHTAPKKCMLNIKFSDKINDARFILTILNQFKQHAKTPMKLINQEDIFGIEIGTDFQRCNECTRLLNEYREFLGDIIIHKGNCTKKEKYFSEEDYFD